MLGGAGGLRTWSADRRELVQYSLQPYHAAADACTSRGQHKNRYNIILTLYWYHTRYYITAHKKTRGEPAGAWSKVRKNCLHTSQRTYTGTKQKHIRVRGTTAVRTCQPNPTQPRAFGKNPYYWYHTPSWGQRNGKAIFCTCLILPSTCTVVSRQAEHLPGDHYH